MVCGELVILIIEILMLLLIDSGSVMISSQRRCLGNV